MLEFLNRWLLAKKAGTAPVSIQTVGEKSIIKAVLWAVDQTGIVVTLADDPKSHVSVPWTSVFAVYVDQ